MCRLGPSLTNRQCPCVESLDAQCFDACADADDVDDRVDGADLMELNALHRHAVNRGLCLSQIV